MGGCLTPQKYNSAGFKKKATLPSEEVPQKITKNNKQKKESQKNKQKNTQKKQKQAVIKQISEQQLYHQYQILQLLNTATTLQGPKLIMNRINGSMKVCRIVRNSINLIQDKLLKFKQYLKAELYKIGQYYIFISELLTGPTLFQYLINNQTRDCSDLVSKIIEIIQNLHKIELIHGNLSLDSFRFDSLQCKQLKLCQLNFFQKGQEFLIYSHKNSKQGDWQFIGLLLSIINQGNLPNYSRQSLQYKNLSVKLIQSFLQGKFLTNQLTNFKLSMHIGVKKFYKIYLLKMSIYKLLKIKQKHRRQEYDYFYDIQTLEQLKQSRRPAQDKRLQIQRERIIQKIKKDEILSDLDETSIEQFLKISIGGITINSKINQFKSCLKIKEENKKLQEINYKITNILN